MLQERDSRLDIHDVALAGLYEADYLLEWNLCDEIATKEVGVIVGFFPEPEDGAGPTG